MSRRAEKSAGEAAPTLLSCAVALPRRYRNDGVLAYHRRDAQQLSERVSGRSLEKAFVWRSLPACLSIRFERDRACAELAIDGAVAWKPRAEFEAMIRRMLGLDQPIEQFERRYGRHPELGPLVARQRGLRVPVAATPFEALSWAITGQQISVAAAVTLRRRLISAAGVRHSSGLLCYPQADQVAALSEQRLREAGYTRAKAATLFALSKRIVARELPLDTWLDTLPVEEMTETLGSVRGIGPWTIHYTLLRGFGWLDGSLHGDVAARRGLAILLRRPDRIEAKDTCEWLAQFSPWRALVAAHLWAMQSSARHRGRGVPDC